MAARQKAKGTRAELREMILSGYFKPGTFLPSVRELAERLQIPKSTVHVILKMLHTEGLIQLQPKRRGALVLDTGNRKKKRSTDFFCVHLTSVISAVVPKRLQFFQGYVLPLRKDMPI